MSIWTWLRGGWRTHGPNAVATGAFDSQFDSDVQAVTADLAMKLSAVWACMHIRAESIGSMPLHIRDANKKVIKDHDLYDILHRSPNAMQTAAEITSFGVANVDLHGNSYELVNRRASDRKIISLEPFDDPSKMTMDQRKSGEWYYEYDGDKFDARDILHYKGFSTNRYMGLPRIDIGRHILSAQLTANRYALRSFEQGLKVGGFFQVEQSLNDTQLVQWKRILDEYGKNENAGKWLTLLKGMKPVGGAEFRIKPAEAELLASRAFGIEEICRLFNVPPQLIGHTDKASSWASSIENINLFFLVYSVIPTIVRREQRIEKTLLTSYDRAKGLEARYSAQGLLRGDMKTRQMFYESALRSGWMNQNEVRDLEERGNIPGGDEYRVQAQNVPLDNGDKGNENQQ